VALAIYTRLHDSTVDPLSMHSVFETHLLSSDPVIVTKAGALIAVAPPVPVSVRLLVCKVGASPGRSIEARESCAS
jgi:hypothetical protein